MHHRLNRAATSIQTRFRGNASRTANAEWERREKSRRRQEERRRREEAEAAERRRIDEAARQLAATQAQIASLRSELDEVKADKEKRALEAQAGRAADGELDSSSVT
jgi:hypothetical protein